MKVNDENRRMRIRIHTKMSWIRNTAFNMIVLPTTTLCVMRKVVSLLFLVPFYKYVVFFACSCSILEISSFLYLFLFHIRNKQFSFGFLCLFFFHFRKRFFSIFILVPFQRKISLLYLFLFKWLSCFSSSFVEWFPRKG